MASVPSLPSAPPSAPRAPRSKLGCLTCRRRKVRCNEQRPRCSHCERLNLQCEWRHRSSTLPVRRQQSNGVNLDHVPGSNVQAENPTPFLGSEPYSSMVQDPRYNASDGPFNDIFNYASFMWDLESQNGPIQTSTWRELALPDTDIFAHRSEMQESTSIESSSLMSNHVMNSEVFMPRLSAQNFVSSSSAALEDLDDQTNSSEEHILREYFESTVVPPILAQVETQLKWTSMRQILIAMSMKSTMVRYAILAFSKFSMDRKNSSPMPLYQGYYDNARAEISQYRASQVAGRVDFSTLSIEHILAALFLLSYIDLLGGRIVEAHSNLKDAYDVFQEADKSQLRTVSKRLLSWIRLLDARAVSAGGEGLFLSEADDILAQSSPMSTDISEIGAGEPNVNFESDIEDILFDSLYQPGFIFFQQIQSFMGRISKIDQWHRSRGTVEDETEVISIAAKISRDLDSLWEIRPPLMDHAIAGRLTSAHISPSLVFTITRTFRTYFANFNASRIHLHRVAYKHLPLSAKTKRAVSNISETARIMVTAVPSMAPEEEEMLPVNMLWPLLMWGCEENDAGAREWIVNQITRMEKVATNAKITTQVLSEVQRRQDSLGQRVDVRTVMHDIFRSCFAIV